MQRTSWLILVFPIICATLLALHPASAHAFTPPPYGSFLVLENCTGEDGMPSGCEAYDVTGVEGLGTLGFSECQEQLFGLLCSVSHGETGRFIAISFLTFYDSVSGQGELLYGPELKQKITLAPILNILLGEEATPE
jgi:hypothetical protein